MLESNAARDAVGESGNLHPGGNGVKLAFPGTPQRTEEAFPGVISVLEG